VVLFKLSVASLKIIFHAEMYVPCKNQKKWALLDRVMYNVEYFSLRKESAKSCLGGTRAVVDEEVKGSYRPRLSVLRFRWQRLC
jgi:hypothetical protein